MRELCYCLLFAFPAPLHLSCQPSGPSLHWEEGTPPNTAYRYHVAVTWGNRLYVVGGDNHGAFEMYDPAGKKWSLLAPLPTPRAFIGGAMLDNSLYVIGGIGLSKKYSSVVERYDMVKNKWTRCRSLNPPRSRLAAVSLHGSLWAIGGLEGTSDKDCRNSAIVEQYDPVNDQWIRKADMPTARHGHAAVVLANKIVVAGGYTDSGPTAIVEEYDPRTNKWTRKSAMPIARGFLGLIALHNQVYAIGGRIASESGPVERYDPSQNRWIPLDPLPEARHRFGIAITGKQVYLIGGEERPQSMLIGSLTQ